MSKPREFDLFLNTEPHKGWILAQPTNFEVPWTREIGTIKIHVIEYSAYEKLKKQCELLVEALERLKLQHTFESKEWNIADQALSNYKKEIE